MAKLIIEGQEHAIKNAGINRTAEGLRSSLVAIKHARSCIRFVADALLQDHGRTPTGFEVYRTLRSLSSFAETHAIAVQSMQHISMRKIGKTLESSSSMNTDTLILQEEQNQPLSGLKNKALRAV